MNFLADTDIQKFLERNGYENARFINAVGVCAIKRFVFTTGLVIGIHPDGYIGRYCYSNKKDAEDALLAWDGTEDPSGDWIKYKGEGGERANSKNGDA